MTFTALADGSRTVLLWGGKPVLTLEGLEVQDWSGAIELVTPDSVSASTEEITRTYTLSDRTVSEAITVGDDFVRVQLDLSYTGSVNAARVRIPVRVLNPYWGRASERVVSSGDTIVAWFDKGSGVGHLSLEDGEVEQQYVWNAAGEEVRRDYQKRVNGDSRSLDVTFTAPTRPAPTLIVPPSGAAAALMFNVHADGQTLDTARAVLNGTSDTGAIEYGTQGFIGRGVVTSWSAFHTGDANNIGLDTADFKSLMDDLLAAGSAIMPHRTRPIDTNTRADAVSHLPDYETWYSSRDWVDHSLSGGARNIGLLSLGWDSTETDYYIMDLLETHGYDLAWAYVDVPLSDTPGLNQQDARMAGAYRGIAYDATHLTLDPSGAPLTTYQTWREPLGGLFDRLTETNLDVLINEFGVGICHEYFAYTGQDGTMFTGSSPVIITDALDGALASIKERVDAGSLWNPTIEAFVDRWRLISGVTIAPTSGGWTVTNSTGGAITGVAFALVGHSGTATLGGVSMSRAEYAGGTVVYADLPAGDSTLVIQ